MSIAETVQAIQEAATWSQRIAQIRLIPQKHGTGEQPEIYAAVARELYMPHLAPDFAYIHRSPFYEAEHFRLAYQSAEALTQEFTRVSEDDLTSALLQVPRTLLVFRTLLGLTRDEFAHSTQLLDGDAAGVSAAMVDSMERSSVGLDPAGQGSTRTPKQRLQARSAARAVVGAMDGSLFGTAPPGVKLKQEKPDTAQGWASVQAFAQQGVPLEVFLHQRHYGGAFRQVLDATSTRRGDLIEDAVEAMFQAADVAFIRTGSHNQADIARRFEVRVTPAPDFVVFDPADDGLRAMLECKGTNNGGTARDKALRFRTLRAEATRLGGVPLFAVLGGMGWARINDALGPVVRDTDGRVFTLATLPEMLEVAPFPGLRG